jgi:hypothetical protein
MSRTAFVEEVSAGRAAFHGEKIRPASGRSEHHHLPIGTARQKKGSFDEIDGAAPQSLEEIVGEVSKTVGWRDRKEQ